MISCTASLMASAILGVHLLELFELLGSQDVFYLCLSIGLQIGNLLFLIFLQVECLSRTGR